MATIGSSFTIVKLTGGYIITNVGNKKAFSSDEELFSHLYSVWNVDMTTAVTALAVDANKRYAAEMSIDGGVTYYEDAVATIVRIESGATNDVANYKKIGYTTLTDSINEYTQLACDSLVNACNGLAVGDSLMARLDES